jgi:ribosome maturation factor RimP
MVEVIEQAARQVCLTAGVEFYELDVKPQREGRNVTVYINAAGGVTIDQCAQVSRLLGEELDRIDPIPGKYALEVSSAGLERKLTRPEHWVGAIGEQVRIQHDREGKSVVTVGVLTEQTDAAATLRTPKDVVVIPRASIKKARTVFDLNAELKRC